MAASREEVFERVKEVLAERLGVDETEFTEVARFEEDLDADSLDLVELAMALEEELKLEIPDDDLEGIRTVGDAVEFVAERVATDV
jgi:acyl carrier protein